LANYADLTDSIRFRLSDAPTVSKARPAFIRHRSSNR
jgi:hypothetical protein